MRLFSKKKQSDHASPDVLRDSADEIIESREYNNATEEVSLYIGRNTTDAKCVFIAFKDNTKATVLVSLSEIKGVLTDYKPYSLKKRLVINGYSEDDAERISRMESSSEWVDFPELLRNEIGETLAREYLEHTLVAQLHYLNTKEVTESYIDFLSEEQQEALQSWNEPSIAAHELSDMVEYTYTTRMTQSKRVVSADYDDAEVILTITTDINDTSSPILKIIDQMDDPVTIDSIIKNTEDYYPAYYVYENISSLDASGDIEIRFPDSLEDNLPEDEPIAETIDELTDNDGESTQEHIDDLISEQAGTDWFMENTSTGSLKEVSAFDLSTLISRDPSWDHLLPYARNNSFDESLINDIEYLDNLEDQVVQRESELSSMARQYLEGLEDYSYFDNSQSASEKKDDISDLFFQMETLETERDLLNEERMTYLKKLSHLFTDETISKRIDAIANVERIAKRDSKEDKLVEAEMSEDMRFVRSDYTPETNPLYYKISKIMGVEIFEESIDV